MKWPYVFQATQYMKEFYTQLVGLFKNVGDDMQEQKDRVDTLIQGTPQPSEVVDMRLGRDGQTYPVARDMVLGEIGKTEAAQAAVNEDTAAQLADIAINPASFGAVNDGQVHTLSEFYSTLSAAQAIYPAATSLDNNINDLALQKSFDYCHNSHFRCLLIGLYYVTASLNAYDVPIDSVRNDYGDGSDSGFICGADGITVLTVSGTAITGKLVLFGNNHISNGFLSDGCLLAKHGKIRAYKFDGFGVKINRINDSIIEDISVEQCGNENEYAISINDAGDTTNTSHFLRIQAEDCKYKAIFISPNTLCCKFDCIHSEGALGDGVNVTWQLGGDSVSYDVVRLQGDDALCKANLFGGTMSFKSLRIEGNIETVWQTSGSKLSIESSSIQGNFHQALGDFGVLKATGTSFQELTGDQKKSKYDTCTIDKLTCGLVNSVTDWYEDAPIFENCEIHDLDSASTQSAGIFKNCAFTYWTKLLYAMILDHCKTPVLAADATYKKLILIKTTINGDLHSGGGVLEMYNSRVTGSLLNTDLSDNPVNPIKRFINDRSSVGQTVSSAFNQLPTAGPYFTGEKSYYLNPSSGGFIGFVVIAGGDPGTIKEFGQISA
ncbi:hypothetical protein NOM01_04565 [Sporolactobacillus sp. STSJ-5]|uniref:hypothetical protein n=1 Tax=Sporolactobacillus sp. STSJ-5 TaxID=2965076 RepID=UPI00210354F3|nr:hypothetical protein [Sporolactobacillus sp. STSJ-5]MCQ2009267.1 hypothetical protein [Sporolactobacillus sp. STSJ-5]